MAAPQSSLPEYDLARKRLLQQRNTDSQTQDESLKRGLSARGGLGSGTYLKLQQQNQDNLAQQYDNNLEGINTQESAQLRNLAEVQAGRDFQSQEAEKGRAFQSGETALQRLFANQQLQQQQQYGTSERLGGQQFASGQLGAQQKFATGERVGTQEFAGSEAQKVRDVQQQQFGQEFGLKQQAFDVDKTTKLGELELQQRQFDLDKETTSFNKLISAWSLPEGQGRTVYLANLANDPNVPPAMRAGLQVYVDSVANSPDVAHLLPADLRNQSAKRNAVNFNQQLDEYFQNYYAGGN